MKLKAIIWPEQRRIGSYEIQKAYGGDPSVLKFFPNRFITNKELPDNMILIEVSEQEWRSYAKAWSDAKPVSQDPRFH